jgi:hypothetical protein
MMTEPRCQASRAATVRGIWLEAAVRWAARLVASFLLGLMLLLLLGEGPPPVWRLPPNVQLLFAAQVVTLVGLVVLWFWELPGGLLTLGGIIAFYAINYLESGRFPSGWVFPLFYVPGILAVISWMLSRRRTCLAAN